MTAPATARRRITQTSREQTNRNIDERQVQELERMPGERGEVARATRGHGLPVYIDQERDRAQNQPLVDARMGEIGSRNRDRDLRRGIYARNVDSQISDRAETGIMRDRLDRTTAGDVETVTETTPDIDPVEHQMAVQAIRNEARRRGATTVEEIAEIAEEFGYDLEGGELGSPAGFRAMFGLGGGPELQGGRHQKAAGQNLDKKKS